MLCNVTHECFLCVDTYASCIMSLSTFQDLSNDAPLMSKPSAYSALWVPYMIWVPLPLWTFLTCFLTFSAQPHWLLWYFPNTLVRLLPQDLDISFPLLPGPPHSSDNPKPHCFTTIQKAHLSLSQKHSLLKMLVLHLAFPIPVSMLHFSPLLLLCSKTVLITYYAHSLPYVYSLRYKCQRNFCLSDAGLPALTTT